MNLTTNSWIKQADGFVSADMDGEIVMLHVEHGKYYNLGSVGGDIWNLLAGEGATVRQIIAGLLETYDVSEQTCEAEVLPFLENMLSLGIIAVSAPQAK